MRWGRNPRARSPRRPCSSPPPHRGGHPQPLRPMSSPAPRPPSSWKVRLIQTFLAILLPLQTILLSIAVCVCWPVQNAEGKLVTNLDLLKADSPAELAPVTEMDLLFLVMACGALGATLHALYSFCDYVGNRRFQISWTLWYLGRLPIGMAVATVLYLALRGGFTGFSGGLKDLNIYGIAGIAALTGMFSRQAVTKLAEISNTIFTKLPPQPDALQHPRATLTAIKPPLLAAGTTKATIRLEGHDFVPGLRVVVDHMLCEAKWLSATEIECQLCEKLIDDPTTLTVAVRNPDPSPGESETLALSVVAPAELPPPTPPAEPPAGK